MDMKYGFFHTRPGATQADGLYVERSGRILLWPLNKHEAYEIDEKTAVAWTRRDYVFIVPLLALYLLLWLNPFTLPLININLIPGLEFSDEGRIHCSWLVLFLVSIALVKVLARTWVPRRFIANHSSQLGPLLNLRRPPVTNLKPLEQIKSRLVLISLPLLPVACGTLFLMAGQERTKSGDSIAAFLMGFLIALFFLWILIRQINGTPMSKTWFYKMDKQVPSASVSPHPLGPLGSS